MSFSGTDFFHYPCNDPRLIVQQLWSDSRSHRGSGRWHCNV